MQVRFPFSSLAQLVERMTVNHDVAGPSPAGGAMIIGCIAACAKSLVFQGFFVFRTFFAVILFTNVFKPFWVQTCNQEKGKNVEKIRFV